MFAVRAIATSMSGAGGKKLFNIVPAPIVSHDTNHPPLQPTHPRVTEIYQLLILTFLHAADDIQTLSRTPCSVAPPTEIPPEAPWSYDPGRFMDTALLNCFRIREKRSASRRSDVAYVG